MIRTLILILAGVLATPALAKDRREHFDPQLIVNELMLQRESGRVAPMWPGYVYCGGRWPYPFRNNSERDAWRECIRTYPR